MLSSPGYIQQQLHRRFERLQISGGVMYHSLLIHFWKFINDNEILGQLAAALLLPHPEVSSKRFDVNFEFTNCVYKNEHLHTIFAAKLVSHCVNQADSNFPRTLGQKLTRNQQAFGYLGNQEGCSPERAFTDYIVEPLYFYFYEALDSQVLAHALLLRYKRKCEWFQQQQLKTISAAGERALSMHLAEFLYDRDIVVTIEPKSNSGEPDFVLEIGGTQFVTDSKLYRGTNLDAIAKGFYQLYLYLQSYNQTFGYLIIYKTTEEELHLALPTLVPHIHYLHHSGKMLCAIIVDVCNSDQSASRRGKIARKELTEEKIITVLAEETSRSSQSAFDDIATASVPKN